MVHFLNMGTKGADGGAICGHRLLCYHYLQMLSFCLIFAKKDNV